MMRASVFLCAVLVFAGCGGADTAPSDADVREPPERTGVDSASVEMGLAPILPDSASVE